MLTFMWSCKMLTCSYAVSFSLPSVELQTYKVLWACWHPHDAPPPFLSDTIKTSRTLIASDAQCSRWVKAGWHYKLHDTVHHGKLGRKHPNLLHLWSQTLRLSPGSPDRPGGIFMIPILTPSAHFQGRVHLQQLQQLQPGALTSRIH